MPDRKVKCVGKVSCVNGGMTIIPRKVHFLNEAMAKRLAASGHVEIVEETACMATPVESRGAAAPRPRRRGRPRGSKNKVK